MVEIFDPSENSNKVGPEGTKEGWKKVVKVDLLTLTGGMPMEEAGLEEIPVDEL